MNGIVDGLSRQTLTAFVLFIILVWISGALGIVLVGILRPELPGVVVAIADPNGTAASRSDQREGNN